MSSEILNARISTTFLGYDDHGIFTLYLTLEMDGAGIVVGGYALDTWNGIERTGTAKGMNLLAKLLQVVGVSTWEELPNQPIRVVSNGLGRKISKIGHLMQNEWLDFEEFFMEEEAQ